MAVYDSWFNYDRAVGLYKANSFWNVPGDIEKFTYIAGGLSKTIWALAGEKEDEPYFFRNKEEAENAKILRDL